MQSYMDETIESHMHHLAWKALRTIEHNPQPCNYIITTSSGSSVTVIPVTKNYVLQVFTCNDIYLNVLQFWHAVQHNNLEALIAPILDHDDTINMIKVQKVHPLNDFSYHGANISGLDVHILEKEVTHIIEQLGEYGLVQGDTRLDNVGTYDGHYVLFDYDNAKLNVPVTAINRDLQIFQKSLRYTLSA